MSNVHCSDRQKAAGALQQGQNRTHPILTHGAARGTGPAGLCHGRSFFARTETISPVDMSAEVICSFLPFANLSGHQSMRLKVPPSK